MNSDSLSHKTPYRVIYGDTDNMGVAYHANYLRWFEIGRTELLRSWGLPYRQIESRGLLLPVAEAQCKFAAPAKYDDMLQVGTRNMQNYALLIAVGQTNMPVLLKRGMMSTIEELLMSAEYIMSNGNHKVILCERGIRTFEKYTRNTLDINAVPVLKELTHLPVVVDPSHATGKWTLVKAASGRDAKRVVVEILE